MKPYLFKTPALVTRLFPSLLWEVKGKDRGIYLTFDDGPTPEVTPYVLDLLDSYQAKATFFCIGKNITAHPNIYKDILNRGHRVGNHTFNHLNAKMSDPEDYMEDVRRTEAVMQELREAPLQELPRLFRPPYGRMTSTHSKALLQENYQIVMWSLLSADFDPDLDTQKSLKKLKKYSREGSIVVFHDSLKAYENLKALLPEYLRYLKTKGKEIKRL